MSYHNGSVWPHDNALIAAGLMRYGYVEHAQRIATGLLDAAARFGGRLPELFCGFDRTEFDTPVPYPTSCSPQAWAAASPTAAAAHPAPVRPGRALRPGLARTRRSGRPRRPPDRTAHGGRRPDDGRGHRRRRPDDRAATRRPRCPRRPPRRSDGALPLDRQDLMTRPVSLRPMRLAMIAPPWFTVPPVGYGGVENMCADLVDGLVARGHEVSLIGQAGPARRPTASSPPTPNRPAHGSVSRCPKCCTPRPRPASWSGSTSTWYTTTRWPVRSWRAGAASRPSSPCTGRSWVSRESTGNSRARSTSSPSRAARRGAAPDLAWRRAPCTTRSTSGALPFRAEKDEDGCSSSADCTRTERAPGDRRRASGRACPSWSPASAPSRSSWRTCESHVRAAARPGRHAPRTRGRRRRSGTCWPGAAALLFPILWDEPFGMVMIEAMACGTPVVALRRGSVPEVVVDGDHRRGLRRRRRSCPDGDQRRPAASSPADCREHVRTPLRRRDHGDRLRGSSTARAILDRLPVRPDDLVAPGCPSRRPDARRRVGAIR